MKNKNENSRQRSANFSRSETLTLVDISLNYRDVINIKKTDFKTAALKNKAWDKITAEFNRRTCGERTVKTIRNKLDMLKKDVRKKLLQNANKPDLRSYETAVLNNFLDNFMPEETTSAKSKGICKSISLFS